MDLEQLKEEINNGESISEKDIEIAKRMLKKLKELKKGNTWKGIAESLEISDSKLTNIRKELKEVEENQPNDSEGSSDTDRELANSMTDAQRRELKIFISHKHENREYATVLREQLLGWNLTNEQIVQTSSAEAATPLVGSELNREIKQFLYDCHLVIFIYTKKELNWEWCSYEIGVAEDPKVDTRISTIQIYDDEPVIQKHRTITLLNLEDVKKFVKDFYRRPGVFPGYPPYFPEMEDTAINLKAELLYNSLLKAKAEDKLSDGSISQESRWGSVKLRVEGEVINPLYEEWSKAEDTSHLKDKVYEALKENLKIIGNEQQGLLYFGLAPGTEDLPIDDNWNLKKLEQHWRASIDDASATSWLDEILEEIWAFRTGHTTKLSGKPYESSYSKYGFYPMVTHVYKHPNGSREYDIYTFIFKTDS